VNQPKMKLRGLMSFVFIIKHSLFIISLSSIQKKNFRAHIQKKI